MRSRYALIPLTGKGVEGDAYRPDLPAGTSWAGSIPTDDGGHPVADHALVHLWGDDDRLGTIDASGLVLDVPANTDLGEVAARERRRWKKHLKAAGRPVDLRSGMRGRHLIRAAGQTLEPWFHESNLRVSAPQLAGGAELSETFSGTTGVNLTSRSSDSGHSWTKYTAIASGDIVVSSANRGRGAASSGTSMYYSSYAPAGVGYDVTFDEKYFTSAACIVGVCARLDSATGTTYIAYFRIDLGEAHIYKYVSGTPTDLGVWSSASTVDYTGNTFQVRDATKKFFVAGTERVSTTDNAITAAGKVGLYMYQATDSTGFHIDNVATNPPSAAITSPPLAVTVTLPAPTVSASSPNVTVTVPPLAVTATLPAPAVSATTAIWGDTFTDTDGVALSSHTPTGPYASGTWSAWYTASGVTSLKIASNRVRASAGTAVSATAEYHHSQSLTDGYVEADFTKLDATGYAQIGFRHVGTSVSDGAWDAYTLNLAGSTGLLTLGSVKLGSLGTYTIPSFAGTYTIRLRIVGTSLKAYVNGVERISVTDSSISAGGVVLANLNNADGTSTSRGVVLDNLVMSSSTAVDASAAVPPLAVTATLPAPAVSLASVTINVTAAGIPLLFGDQSPLFVAVKLPSPTVSTTVGSSNATITSPPLAVTARLMAPAVVIGTLVPPLAVAVTLPAPAISISSASNVTVTSPALAVTIALPIPTGTFRTYTRPFTCPLDIARVTAPLDISAATAPLDMETTVT